MALVVVQRGHCFRTTGATGAPGEQAFTKAAADRVAHQVRALGHEVRVINADVPNDQYRGDLFIALHYDSSTNPSARGASVGWQTDEGRRFAEAWKQAYAAHGWTGGFRGDNYTNALANYYGVRRAVSVGNRTAFISEAGFHSSPADAALLAAPEGPDRVGRAVAVAVASLVGGTPPPEEDDMFDPTTHGKDLAAVKAAVAELHEALTSGRIARQVWAHDVASLPTKTGAAADLMRRIRASVGADVDEAAVAAALAPVLSAALVNALPASVVDQLTVEDVEVAAETAMRTVLADAGTSG